MHRTQGGQCQLQQVCVLSTPSQGPAKHTLGHQHDTASSRAVIQHRWDVYVLQAHVKLESLVQPTSSLRCDLLLEMPGERREEGNKQVCCDATVCLLCSVRFVLRRGALLH
jgi:hypothetical protein